VLVATDDSEDELVGTAATPLAHMISQLEDMNNQMTTCNLLQPNKKPQFVLTNGNKNSNGSYILFDPKLLTSSMLKNSNANGAPDLFFGCDVPSCRIHQKKKGTALQLQRKSAPKFALRLRVRLTLHQF
jgi:hypothetical protein